MLTVGQFMQEYQWVRRKWPYCVHCKLCDIMIVVCWQLDTLCRSISGSAGSDRTVYTVNCVTLWLLYVTVGHFMQEYQWVSRKLPYCVHCKLCDIMIVVCWLLDNLCRSVRGSAGSNHTVYTVNCATLWFLYVGSWTVCAGVWVGQQEVTVLITLSIVWHYDCCVLAVGQFVQECEWVSRK
jgi:hypothetical protein